MNHTTRTRFAGIVATGGLLMAAIAAPSAALATQPAPDHKVTICHATNSDTNPYVLERADIASSGHLRGGHDTRHDGPIWDAGLKARHVAWGDIIPAYAYGEFSYPGQNLEAGQAILDGGCVIAAAAEETPGDEQPSEAAEEQPSEAAEEQPTDATPPDEQPTDETPTDAAPTDEQPTDATPTDEQPTDAAPTDETPTDEQPTDATPTDETPTDETPTDEQPTDDGEVVIDEGFITPAPVATPVGAVLGATGRPDMTPPATDTIAAPSTTTAGGGIQLILLALAGLSTLVLMLGRVPAARRS